MLEQKNIKDINPDSLERDKKYKIDVMYSNDPLNFVEQEASGYDIVAHINTATTNRILRIWLSIPKVEMIKRIKL